MATDSILGGDLRAALFRQRRQLLVITLILAVYYGLDVTIQNEVSVSGLKLNVEVTWRLIALLWIIWAYSLYRYWLYARAIPLADIERLRQQHILAAVIPLARASLLEAGRRSTPPFSDPEHVRFRPTNKAVVEPIETGGALVHGVIGQSYKPASGQPVGPAIGVDGELSPREFQTARAIARRQMATHFYLTDIYAPYIFALLAPLAAAGDVVPNAWLWMQRMLAQG